MHSIVISEYGILGIRDRLKKLVDQLEKFQRDLPSEPPIHGTYLWWRNQFWDLEREARKLTETLLMYPMLCPTWSEVEVLEMDQWSASAKNLGELSFADFREGADGQVLLVGGDVKAAQAIFGGHYLFKKVSLAPHERPTIGRVWLQENPETKKLMLWKHNYDSSG